jgi:hypothetical protein
MNFMGIFSIGISTWHYIKINAAALLIITAIITAFIIWLLPGENKIDQQIYAKNSELSNNYDAQSNNVIDLNKESQLQIQIKQIKSSREIYKIVKVAFYSVILTVLTGILATLLQGVYTKLKFTNNLESSQRVLSAALFSSALIVCVVFIIVYYPAVAAVL